MPDPSAFDPLDPAIRDLVRRKARVLARGRRLAPQDRDDIEQELLLHLLRRAGAFRPARGKPAAFAHTLLERQAAKLVRDRSAAKRNDRRVLALDAVDPGRADVADPHADVEDAARARDVADVLARLPAEQRDLAERLMRGPLGAVARELGVPRSTLVSRVQTIRRRLERTGLKDHLENPSDTS